MSDVNYFFDYDGKPAYRDDKGFMVVHAGGVERPVTDLVKFVDNAQPISEAEFQKMKHEASAQKPVLLPPSALGH